MHRAIPWLAAAGVILTGCGGSSGAPGAVAGVAASDIVRTAARPSAESFRFALTGHLSADTSGVRNVSPATMGSFGPLTSGLSFTAGGEAESSKRLRATVRLNGSTTPVVAVTYDGTSYVSNDGGHHFAVANQGGQGGAAIGSSPDSIDNLLRALPAAHDLGEVTDNGVDVERIQSVVDQSAITSLLQQPSSSGSTPNASASALSGLITVRSGTADVFVRRDTGRLERATVRADFSFDVGAMYRELSGAQAGPDAPAGAVRFSFNDDARYSDYGARITVSPPPLTAVSPPAG